MGVFLSKSRSKCWKVSEPRCLAPARLLSGIVVWGESLQIGVSFVVNGNCKLWHMPYCYLELCEKLECTLKFTLWIALRFEVALLLHMVWLVF